MDYFYKVSPHLCNCLILVKSWSQNEKIDIFLLLLKIGMYKSIQFQMLRGTSLPKISVSTCTPTRKSYLTGVESRAL